ncbi:hypothetical protein C8035_v005792 [Colletotrichum spinosum]|uniref:Uncharacterized protein n=1 Tax=Colletotrichum spinosum TaxID=1347390 RepID=A0A4R8QI93_9PEZI|nr:hypothetical protein C8035_v005792 [Colletotrichum spinosum]
MLVENLLGQKSIISHARRRRAQSSLFVCFHDASMLVYMAPLPPALSRPGNPEDLSVSIPVIDKVPSVSDTGIVTPSRKRAVSQSTKPFAAPDYSPQGLIKHLQLPPASSKKVYQETSPSQLTTAHLNMVASSRFATIASVFAVGTSAAAIHRRFDFQPNENAYWLAHDYKWGCSPGGCSANFNLVGKEGYASGAPGFDVVCSPIYVQRSWVECLTQDGRPLSETSKVYAVWQEGPDNELHYLNAAHVFYNEDEGSWYDAQSAAQIVPGQDIAFKFLVDTVVNAEGGIKPAASPTTVVEQVETPVAEVKTAPETVSDDSTQPEDSSQPQPTAVTVEEPAPTDTQESNGNSAVTVEVNSEPATQSLPEPVPPAGENIPGLDTTSEPIPETQPLSSTESTGSGDNTPADSNPADGTASTAEPAPDSQPTETPTPEAEPSPKAEAPEAVSPEAEPSPTAEALEAVSPDAEPSAAVEPTETAAPDAEPSPVAEPVETAAPEADSSPVVEPTVAAITPEADPSPVSKSEPEPEPESEPTTTAAPETTQEPDATEAEEPVPIPSSDDSEEVPPVDDSNFLVLAQPLAVPKTAESATPSIEVLAQPILEAKPTKTALPSFEVMAQPLRTGSPNIPKVPEGGDGA